MADGAPFQRSISTQLALLGVCAVVIGVSIVLDGDSHGVSVWGVPVPPLCLFNTLTGWRCPGCGLTRSFVFMGQAMPWQALKMNVFGPMLWLFLAAQLPYRALMIGRALRMGNAQPRGVSE